MKNNHEDTGAFMRYAARPEFLAVVLTFVGVMVTIGIAWGTMVSKADAQDKAAAAQADAQEKSSQALWKAVNENKKEADSARQADHDQITRIDENVKEILRRVGGVENTIGNEENRNRPRER